mgnify:CR=1 FL=1
MKFTLNQIDYADEKTWNMLCQGCTVGVFQFETRLAQSVLKKIKPRTIWELSVCAAILRPGALKSGAVETYAENKDHPEKIKKYNVKVVDDILNTTQFTIVFQEQFMLIAADLAWPHLPEQQKKLNVDILRKAIGKKNQQKILEIGNLFIEGCNTNGVEKEISASIFEVIKNAGRYAFNLSHSMAYAHLAYKTAYMKANFPDKFFATYLTYAKFKLDKWEEIVKLTEEAKIIGLDVLPPNINHKNKNFRVEDGNLRYGLSHIKYGLSAGTFDVVQNLPPINSWKEFILLCFTDNFGMKLRSNTALALISTNAFSDTGVSRSTLASLYKLFDCLTDKEMEHLLTKLEEAPSDLTGLKEWFLGAIKANKKRLPIITSHCEYFVVSNDDPRWIESEEKYYLGTALTSSSVDAKEHTADSTCADCAGDWPIKTIKTVAVVLDQVIQTTTKRGSNPGQKMARIFVRDATASIGNIPIFPEEFMIYEDLLIERNTVQIEIEMGKTGWILKNCQQI